MPAGTSVSRLAQADPAPAAASGGKGSKRGRRSWVLFVLTFIDFVNFLDRSVIYIVQEQIRNDFGLSDQQIGLLGGTAFGIFYGIVGLPIARLAERMNRRNIIMLAVATWSLLTAICGVTQTFVQLLLARAGVAVGEAGGTPPSHSIISDYYPPGERATALSIYTLAVPAGVLAGAVGGGALAASVGWRWTFVLFAIPGLIAALLTLTIREPSRGQSDAAAATATAPPPFREVLEYAWRLRVYVHVAAGAAVSAFAGYGVQSFTAAFLVRRFDMDIAGAGLAFGLIFGVFGGCGTLLGGVLVDRMGRKDARVRGILPALCLGAAAPLFMLGYAQSNAIMAVAILLIPGMLSMMHVGATYGTIQNSFPPTMRATAVAIALLIQALVGLGLGPLAMGMLSDHFASGIYRTGDYGADCLLAGGVSSACSAASAQGLRLALMAISATFLWSAAHYWRVAVHIAPRRGGASPESATAAD